MIKTSKKSHFLKTMKIGKNFRSVLLLCITASSIAGLMETATAQQPTTPPSFPAQAAGSIPAEPAASTIQNPAAPNALAPNALAPVAPPAASPNALLPIAAPTPASPSSSGSLSDSSIPDDIARFCLNIDSQASDARFELQSQQLQKLRTQIDERIKVLEEKRQAYEEWLNKRNVFLDKAQDQLVDIISKMRPDAAAAQLALVDDVTAASIILKLSPKISSTIMNEMPAEKTANLTRVMVSMQNVPADSPAMTAATNGE